MNNTLNISGIPIPLVELSKTHKTDLGLLYNLLDSIEQYYCVIHNDERLQIIKNFRSAFREHDNIYNHELFLFLRFCKTYILELGKLLRYQGKSIGNSRVELLNFCKTSPIGSSHKTINEIIILCTGERQDIK